MVPYNLSKALAKRGHHVTIFTSDYKVSQEWIESSPNIEVFPLKTRLNFKELYITPSLLKYVNEELKDLDVIHMHNYRTFQNIVVQYYAKKYSVPYVLQAHGSLPRFTSKQSLKWIYDVFFGYTILRDASKVIAINQMEAEQYRCMGVREDNIEIIPNGIDLIEYNDLPLRGSFKKKYDLSLETKYILYLGRIHKIKGIDLLVKAFAKVKEKVDDVKLVIVGPDDGYLKEIMALIKNLAMEKNIIITGPLYGKDKLEVYLDSYVYVLPSRYEIFGMVILEAYACRKIVIASNAESISDLVLHGKTGLLYRPGNVTELANAIVYVLTHPEEARKMGCNARKLVETKYTINSVVCSFENLYESIFYNEKNR